MSVGPKGITGSYDNMVSLGWWRCERKRGYASESTALRVARRMGTDLLEGDLTYYPVGWKR